MAASEATEAIRVRLKELLDDRFEKEGFEFGPIVVMPCVDDDGTNYLQSYIVFSGDQERLDPQALLACSRQFLHCVECLSHNWKGDESDHQGRNSKGPYHHGTSLNLRYLQ